MAATVSALRLVADIGGTNVRFALAPPNGALRQARSLRCADYDSLTLAVRDYLASAAPKPPPREAALAVACPVHGDRVRMTNHPWAFSIEAVRAELELDRLEVLNDFHALALAVPRLEAGDLEEIKPGQAEEAAPRVLLGPGTGLGMAALVPAAGGWLAIPSEGGHRDLAAASEREWQVVRKLEARFGHVSAERALSGPGLVNLYEAVSRLAGHGPKSLAPEAVVAGARSSRSPACAEAVELFTGWLGAVTGDLALTLGARGGVYLGGGVLPKLAEAFDRQRFTERFLDKGRFRDYLRPVPIRLVVNPMATLLGSVAALAGPASRSPSAGASPRATAP